MGLLSTATRFLLARAALMIILITSFPVVHAATLALTYDANGNLVSGDGKYRVYDGYNQLRYVYKGTNTSVLLQEYEYHPTEERVLSKKTYFANGSLDETVIYFSKQNVRVINSSGSFDFQYIYHEGQLIAQVNPDGTKIFIHADHLGSSTVVTNATGDVVENTTYTPHGEVLSGCSEVRYGYEAKEHDTVVGDTDFHFRKYRADWGLFTQPDSLLPNVYDPQQLNRYMFERGNPYKYTDPDGHAIPVALAAGFLVGFFFGPAIIDIASLGLRGIAWGLNQFDGDLELNDELRDDFFDQMEETGGSFTIPDHLGAWRDAPDRYDAAGDSFDNIVSIRQNNRIESFQNLLINHLNSNQQLGSSTRNNVRSTVIRTTSGGNKVKWYYNREKGTYQYWVGGGKPSNNNLEEVSESSDDDE